MFLGSLKHDDKVMRIYYLKDQHYLSTFLVKVDSTAQTPYEKRIEGLEDLCNEILNFKET